MSVLGIIPARYASTRFPGKPLVEINGKSMLQRVYESACKARSLNAVIIATDDERIANHAKEFGAEAVMTAETHPSGTDRCFEAYRNARRNEKYILNIQGDEPFLDPEQIDSLARECKGDAEILTQMKRCTTREELIDTGEVKIVLNTNNEAMYFSRSVIPFQQKRPEAEWHLHFPYFRHVGMYAYRVDILEKISALKPSPLEIAESLEQLRWLQHGYKVKCVETTFDSHCIDSPADIERVLKLMESKG